jgi:hypothetical protein
VSGGAPAGPAGGGATIQQLQWPFVGVAALLVILILLTPNLFSSGGGSLQTRAELIVDRPSLGGNTSFYVESIGTATRYQSIAVGLAALPAWPYHGNISQMQTWNWTNATDALVLIDQNATNPVALNVTVKYTDSSGATTVYIGVYGFNLNATTLTLQAMNLLPGASAPPPSTPLADLPIFLLLAVQTATGPSQ